MKKTQFKKRTQFDLMNYLFDSLDDSKLSCTQRMLLWSLYRRMDGDGRCYPSYKDIMMTSGLSRNGVATNLKRLVSGGWISYKKGNSHCVANEYQLNLEKIGVEKPKDPAKLGGQKPVDNDELIQINGRYYAPHEVT